LTNHPPPTSYSFALNYGHEGEDEHEEEEEEPVAIKSGTGSKIGPTTSSPPGNTAPGSGVKKWLNSLP
jgi:hypothetical protein